MVIGIFLILLIIQITTLLFDNTYVVFLAGLTAATLPMLVRYSCTLLRENIYLLFSFLSLLFFVKFFKKKYIIHLVMAGVFSAFAFLSRLEGLEIIVIVGILFFFRAFFGKEKKIKASCRFSIFLASFIITAVLTCYFLNFDIIRYADLISKLDFEPLNDL